jgi:hypothetical protein
MSMYDKDSAELAQEVEAQRQRVESRIGEIRDRLSPGQLLDEALSYTKHGGQHFAANLGETVSSNPLPAALLGISLVWLMTGRGPNLGTQTNSSGPSRSREPEFPYATVQGNLRRVSHSAGDDGLWYSEFEDTMGKRYRAEANEKGHRVGAFLDQAGRKFGGFIDETGHRVHDFRDEAGNRLEDAMGWASHTFHDIQQAVGDAIGHAGHQAQRMGGMAGHQLSKANRLATDMFTEQPLVGGALAFAAGAALAAALPHTPLEDKAVGQVADRVRAKAAVVAADIYDEGKSRAGETYESGKEKVAEVYDDMRPQPSTRVN